MILIGKSSLEIVSLCAELLSTTNSSLTLCWHLLEVLFTSGKGFYDPHRGGGNILLGNSGRVIHSTALINPWEILK